MTPWPTIGLTFLQSPIRLGGGPDPRGDMALLYARCRLLGNDDIESKVSVLCGGRNEPCISVPGAGPIESNVSTRCGPLGVKLLIAASDRGIELGVDTGLCMITDSLGRSSTVSLVAEAACAVAARNARSALKCSPTSGGAV